MSDNWLSDKQKHYQKRARYYTNYAILKRLKSAVHLENKNDLTFWGPVFKHYFPDEQFLFIPYSKNQRGNDTSGCAQCLAYKNYLNKNFVICIDSDYRFLLQESGIDIHHYIFQTYTYSFENHLCASPGLSDVCEKTCGFPNDGYDFETFFKTYSHIIYDLFAWHTGLSRKGRGHFSTREFIKSISAEGIDKDVSNQSWKFLSVIRSNVNNKTGELRSIYPHFDLEKEKERLHALGIHPENVYFYIRGHNLYSLCTTIGTHVCEQILAQEKEKLAGNKQKISRMYRNKKRFEEALNQNILFGKYPEICKVENDMQTYRALTQAR